MFDTSKDVLFWVLAASIAVFTFFLCWALYYIVMMLKKAHGMIAEISELIANIKNKLERLEQLFDTIEEKIKSSASYLPLVFKGITELIEFFKKKKEERAKKSKTKDS